MHKLIVTLAIVGGGFFMVKKTNFVSYAETLLSLAKRETIDQIPTKFELELVRIEIANLDRDINSLLRPIAENKVAISQLHRDIQKNEVNLAEQNDSLKTMIRDLEGNAPVLIYAGKEYPADRIRQIVQREFDSFQRLEKHLITQKKLLEAKEKALVATQEQLTKMIGQKKDYEVRLAQLEAEHETLRIAAIGTSAVIDNTRVNQIEDSLKSLEGRLEVEGKMIELANGASLNDRPPTKQAAPLFNLSGMRDYLEKSPVCAKR